MNWHKKTTLNTQRNSNREIWFRSEGNDELQFPVDTYLGKKTDLLGLKKNIVENIQEKLEYYKTSRSEIYKPENLEEVGACPVCDTHVSETKKEVNIYGAQYASCRNCSHVYVIKRPTSTAISGFYLNDVTYAATYTDKSKAELRLNAIAVPWCNWMIDVYTKQYGRSPKKILDVGSGAGHFVEACRRAGLQAEGIELSESSREFAKDIWDIELDGRDFTQVIEEYKDYDVVTFWGLLEHTPNPKAILAGAHEIVNSSGKGMVISKLPRWDSLSAAIQTLTPDTIIRHLDPMGHIMCFTDSSAAELYYQCDFAPVGAWYYGMDVYEMLMQVGINTGSYDAFVKSGKIQTNLQQYIDEVSFSDGITLVGVPK